MRQPPAVDDTRGILGPGRGLQRFKLTRDAPPPALAGLVEWVWTVQWKLPAGVTHEQQTLPAPCVHLVAEDGTYRVHGPGTARFVTTLRGRGFATGLRFTPAGFSVFTSRAMRALVDRVLPARELFGVLPPPAKTPRAARARLLRVVTAAPKREDPDVARVNALVETLQRDASVVRVEQLAAAAGVSVRTLHRLFERTVGVGSKWMVRRARVQEAAERVKRGDRVDWADVAQQLGYSDQAHLIRDFRRQVGLTPAAYARACRGAR